ncbi:MAG: 30S ribosome-binding factor RbfA [Simkaniaceae bacterium]|nr:30S ribosome-binding factor RbfA [Simkaniaceae bacterium]
MTTRRQQRLGSLLKEVISEVIRDEVRNPNVAPLTSVTNVEITKDMRYAKVYVSVIGSEEQRTKTVEALQTAAGFIGTATAKLVRMRFFPVLTFKLDTTADKQMRIDELLQKVHEERNPTD